MKRLLIITTFAALTGLTAHAQTTYTLAECRRLALENNIKVRDARLDIESAKETQKEARMSYLPEVTAGATYFHANDYLIKDKVSMTEEQGQQLAGTMQRLGLDPTALADLPTDFTIEAIKHGLFVNLMAMQPLYAGGRITTGNKLADLQLEVKQLMLEQSEDDIRRTVEGYYNQLLSLYEKQRTLAAAQEQLASIHRDAQNAFNAGLANKNDVLTVDLKANELSADSLKLENGIKLCRLVLAQYIGHEGEAIDIDRTLADQLPPPETYLVDHHAALDLRTEAQLLDKSVEASELQTRLARGERLPTVALGAALTYNDMTSIGRTKVIGLATVSVPISAWWSKRDVRRRQIAEQQARQDRDDNRQLMLIQMQSAYDDFDNAYKQVTLAHRAIEQANENLRLNRDYYQAGLQGMSDLLDAQTKLQQAQDRLTEATTSYLNCRTAYLLATGREVE